MKWLEATLGVLFVVSLAGAAAADPRAPGPHAGPVLRAHDTVIVDRVQKPIAAIEVPRAKVDLPLPEVRAPFSLRIEQEAQHDPF